MAGDPVESLRALRKRRPWAGATTCPSCHHAYHAGRCHANNEVAPGRLVACRCTYKEETHGSDNPTHGGDAGRSMAGPPVDRAAAQQRLAALEGELAAGAEDLLAGIREVGQTFTDGAARLEGARK